MNATRTLRSWLDEILPLREEIVLLRARRDELGTVPQATAAYEDAVRAEELALGELRLRLAAAEREAAIPDLFPLPVLDDLPMRPRRVPPARREKPASGPRPSRAEEASSHRPLEELRLLVNRFAHAWQIGDDVRGEVNRIADEPGHVLGEVLALLHWELYESPLTALETESQQLARLADWHAALVEYRDRLAGDVAALETQFARSLPLWGLWRARSDGAAWQQFLDDARRSKRDEIERLERELARKGGDA